MNPSSHGIAKSFENYPHSSYKSIVSVKPTLLKRNEVITLFQDLENFKFVHSEKFINEELLKEIISEDI